MKSSSSDILTGGDEKVRKDGLMNQCGAQDKAATAALAVAQKDALTQDRAKQ
jgi:hypothetical protein